MYIYVTIQRGRPALGIALQATLRQTRLISSSNLSLSFPDTLIKHNLVHLTPTKNNKNSSWQVKPTVPHGNQARRPKLATPARTKRTLICRGGDGDCKGSHGSLGRGTLISATEP